MLCISCHFRPLKPLTLWMDHSKLLDVLTSLPVSHAILPRAVCFATSRPANHAICSFIDTRGYVSGPIRMRLFIDYKIKYNNNTYIFKKRDTPTCTSYPYYGLFASLIYICIHGSIGLSFVNEMNGMH